MITVKQSQERSLRTSRSLDTSETQIIPRPLQVPQIPEEFLNPQGRALTDGCQLSGLKVGESKRWERSVGLGEAGETRDNGGELGKEKIEAFTKEDEVGVAAT